MVRFKEGDVVRVRPARNEYWNGFWQITSVIEQSRLAYIQQLDGNRKGYMNMEHLEPTQQNWQAGEHLSKCKRYVEQRADGKEVYSFYVSRPEWMKESTDCGCGGLCQSNSESELNKQMTLF